MIDAAAIRLALEAGWTAPQDIHIEQAQQALEAAQVPKLLARNGELEDSLFRASSVLAWTMEQFTNLANGKFDPSAQLELPPPAED